MRGWPKGSRFFFAGSAGKRTFLIRLCQRMAPMRLDSRAAGRVGTKHVSFRNFMGLSAPHPELLFARAKSNQKHARREKPFRWGFSPVTPSSATTQRGLASAQAPHPSSRRKRQASLAALRLLLPRQTLRWFASERPLRGRFFQASASQPLWRGAEAQDRYRAPQTELYNP